MDAVDADPITTPAEPELGEGAGAAEVAEAQPDELLQAQVSEDLISQYWIPRAELDARRLRTLPIWCEGAYRDVDRSIAQGVDLATLPVELEADAARYFVDERLELSGEVVIERGDRTLRTDRAVIQEQSEEAELSGTVRIEEPGLVLLSNGAQLDLANKAADLADVSYLLTQNGYRGNASAIRQSEQGDLRIEGARVTRCEPGSNVWQVTGRSIDIEDGAIFATARNAVVRIKDVPVFYVPWLRFPISDDRQSGWLFPSIGFSDESGFDLALPYYFNIAKNFDATVTPRVVTQRGFSISGQVRHLNRFGATEVGASFLPNDDRFNGIFDRDDFDELTPGADFNPANRWLYRVDHRGGIGNFETEIDFTAVSDEDYFRDLGSGFASSSLGELERRGEVRYQYGGFGARLLAQRFQRLDEIQTEAYQKLPQLDLTYSGNVVGALQFNVLAQAVSFDRNNDDLTGLAAIVGERFHVQPELRLPFDWPGAFVELAGGVRHTRYDLRDTAPNIDANPERSIGYASVDGGLFFERDLSLFGVSLVQTLEPRLFYLFQGNEDQDELPQFDVTELTFNYNQLFRTNRFSGLDRIADANQLTVGVTTSFSEAATGRELLRARVGQIFNFRDRDVTLTGVQGETERQSTSAIAAEVRAALARRWALNSTLIFDPNDGQIDEAAVALQYRSDNHHIINAGYRNRRIGDLDQLDLSVRWPINRKWGLMGRFNYDLENNRTIDGFAGLEYNDCCWQFRILARRFIENPSNQLVTETRNDDGVFVQFVFKGLAGVGTRLDTLLERGIRGFRSDDVDRYQ